MDTIRIGILYDFDKTLCTTDMQEYDFIKKLGMTSDAFWGEAAAITPRTELPERLEAPVEAGQPVGELILEREGETLAVLPLTAGETVQRLTWADLFVKVLRRAAMAR